MTSATTLSGVEAPDVIPTVNSPSGIKSFFNTKSDSSGLWQIELFSTEILSGVSIWNDWILLVIAISCKWVVF